MTFRSLCAPRRAFPVPGLAFAAVLALALGGCATTRGGSEASDTADAAPTRDARDPLEGLNRGVYRFNDTIDRHALRPAAVAYREHTPGWFQQGVGNFLQNLRYPGVVVNQFLQGKFKEGSLDFARLVLNTTLGWGGLFDVASGAKLPVHDEDFGQTLGRWGMPSGPYLMLPLMGPSTLRDAPTKVADNFAEPFYWYDANAERWITTAVGVVDTRAGLLPLDRTLREAYDPYAFIRDAYLQRRLYLVHDGQPPEDSLEDDDDWIEEAERESEEP